MGASLAGRRILFVTHEWSLTGAPLLLSETARWLEGLGAEAWYTNLGECHPEFPLPPSWPQRAVSIEDAMRVAGECDLVVVNTAAGWPFLTHWAGAPDPGYLRLLWWIHEVDTGTHFNAMPWLNAAGLAAFDSEASRRAWRAVGAIPGRTSVVHPGLPPGYRLPPRFGPWRRRGRHEAARLKARAELGVAPGEFLVGHFASYHPQKGQDLLGATLAGVAERRPDLPLRALFVGFADDAEVSTFAGCLPVAARPIVGERAFRRTPGLHGFYEALDALVVNTQEPGEAFGRVILEAMSYALPVLATSSGGVPEVVVDGQTGLLHPVGQAGQRVLAANLERLMDDRDLARRLGRAGAKRVRQCFSPARFEREVLAAMTAALAGDRRPPPAGVQGS